MKYFYFLVYIAFCSVNLAISSTVSACIQPTIIVTNTDDNKDVDIVGSLRYAIANSCDNGTTTIDFDPSLANQTILLETKLTIDKDINIVNTKAKFLQISGGGSKRIFHVTASGGLFLKNVTIVDGNAVDGGGIYIEPTTTLKIVIINNSTFSNNKAENYGGAIYSNQRKVIITNSTLVGNKAKQGGAIYSEEYEMNIINSTLFGNIATEPSGFGGIAGTGVFILKNTILADNSEGDCGVSLDPLDNINNLIKDGSCDPFIEDDPKFLKFLDEPLLKDNGGFTPTLALSEDPRSPAINAGDPDTCVTEDQRGFPRNSSSDSPCDIGAFEATCEAQQQIPPEECRALINFYDKTNGPNWNDNNGWKVTPEPCSWIGVSCGDGYVTGIIRESKNLLGNLPDLSVLELLTTLNLKGNQLNGKIPSNLNNLTNLEYLYLHNNRFSGPIPDISNLDNLTELLLQNNQLDGEIPPSLVQLANLTRLDLSYNKLIVDSTQVALKELIRTKNPDGLNTQTIHPLNVAATASLSPTQIKLTWDLIPYTEHDGHYLVKCGTLKDLPNRPIQKKTDNKSVKEVIIEGLSESTTYSCVVETYTQAHPDTGQQNDLTSVESLPIEATTLTPSQPPDPPPPDDPVIPSEDTNLDLGSSVIGKSIQGNFNILRNKAIEIVDFQLSGDKEDFDILSPDFPITVNSGQGLNLKVQCIPSNPGLHTTLLQFIPKDSGQTIPQYSLKCTGKQPARYISSPAPNSTIVIGNGLINQTLTQTFSIRAGGEEDLQVYSYTLTGAEANYFAVTAPVFPITIADGSPEKVVTVTCTPPGVENYTAILQLSSNDPTQSTPTYTLKCKGKLPETTDFISTPLPEQTIDFGTSLVGKSITVDLKIANEGNLDLVINAIDLVDNDTSSFEVLNSQLPITLSKNQNDQTIILQCSPTTMGIQTATLHLETNDPDNLTVNYPLICEGLSQSVGFTSTPLPGSELDLGNSPIGEAITVDLSVTKTGNLPLEVNLVAITGAQADNFQLTKPQLPILLADDASTTENETVITVQCIPTQVGIHTAELELQTNDSTIPSPTYTLQCQGITAVPIYNSIPIPYQSLDIGSSEIGQPLTTSLTILQQGTAALEVSSSQITGENAANFQIIQGTAPFSLLESNSEQNLLIQCLPQQLGPLTARLTLETNAPEYLTVYYDLTCTGLPTVNPPSPQIVLSYDRVYEDSPGGTLIGILSTLNSASPTHYYTLVDDANGLFVVQNDELHLVATAQLDFETIPRYTIVVRSTDESGVFFDQTFTIYVNDVSETQFLGKIVTESGTIGKQVTIDAAEKIKVIGYINPGQKQLGQLADLIMTYHWTPHEGGPPLIVPVTVAQQIQLKPNMEITLFEGRLIGLAGLFEVSLGYRLTNGQNLSAPIATLEVRPNRPPTQIQLSNRIIAENTPPETVIGWFTTTDPDQKDYFRYGLIGNQSTGYFKIVDNQLRTNNFRLDYESGTDYPITVRSVDSGGAYIDESFVIQVTDQEVSVVNLYLTRNSITENSSSGTLVGRLWTDGDEPGTYTYEIIKTTPGPFILDGDLLLIAQDVPLDFETQPFYSVAVRSQQSETGQSIEQIFTINVINDVDIAYSGEISSLTTGQRLEPNLIQATDNIMVKIQLFPDQTHYGQTAELFSVALWQALDGTQSMTYMLANNTWKEWNGNLNNLARIQSLTLLEHHELMLWQGQLNSFSGGEFSVFIGYRLMTGELIYNRLNPFKISVQ